MQTQKIKLDCAFLHKRLVLQLLSNVMLQVVEQRIAAVSQKVDGPLRDTFVNSVLTDAVLSILRANKVPSLEELLVKNGAIRVGQLIWFEQDFYFRGTVNASIAYEQGKRPSYSYFHTRLKRYEGLKLTGSFNAAHLFGDTAVSTLSGRKNVFLFAYIKEAKPDEIVVRPIFIGSKMIATDGGFALSTDYLQVQIEEIDEFKEVANISRQGLDVGEAKKYSEKQIKQWFGEILSENNLPKDWGGEKSDLFTNHIHIQGQRHCAAFLLKGPSRFEPMTVKNLGKNGDQISRLYDEPADVYIIQHCHYIRAEIYKNMKAFSGNFLNLSKFCVIDGEDTLRILKAYKKI